jgi:hypothetical protein
MRAERDHQPFRYLAALILIKALQTLAKARNLNAYGGVNLRIEKVTSTKRLRGNRVFV